MESQTVTVSAEEAAQALKVLETVTNTIRTMRDKEARIIQLMVEARKISKPILDKARALTVVERAELKLVVAKIAVTEKPFREEAATATKEQREEAAKERAELKGVKNALYEFVSH